MARVLGAKLVGFQIDVEEPPDGQELVFAVVDHILQISEALRKNQHILCAFAPLRETKAVALTLKTDTN